RDLRHGGRGDHHAGHLRVRAPGDRRGREGPRQVPGVGHPAQVHRAAQGVWHRSGLAPVHEPGERSPGRRWRALVSVPQTSWVSAGLVFLTVVLGTVGLALLLEVVQEARRRRQVVRQLQTLGTLDSEVLSGTGGILRRSIEQQPAWVQSLSAYTPRIRDLGFLIQQSGLTWTVDSLLILCLGLGLGFGAAVLIIGRYMAFAAIAAAFGAYLPIWYLKWKRRKRSDAFEGGLPEAMDLLRRAIRAGHPLSAGLKMVGDEARDPIAEEFQRTFEEQRFGLPFDDAIIA